MSKSPANPKNKTSDDASCYEFDPQVNFSQFLEEARQHAGEEDLHRSDGKKKSKRSWRNSLFFSWWKSDRKSKPGSDPVHVPNMSKLTKGYGSGPLCRTTRGVETPRRRPASGPVSVLFTPTRKMEDEVPYMNLDQTNNDPHQINTYGPVYMVT